MKAVIVLIAVLATVGAVDECYRDVKDICGNTLSKHQGGGLTQCDSKYGAIDSIEPEIEKFANHLLYRSFDFLLMATHYGDYIKNRPGFEKLFRGLSDSHWEDGIDTIKYIASRGGDMNFANIPNELQADTSSLDVYELHALGKALDIEKKLAKNVFDIHQTASGHRQANHDPEIAHHFEEKFMGKHRETIRKLAGHAKDLSNILEGPDASLGLYLFDEYLQN